MLKLRKILLCNYIYLLLFFLTLITVFIRINIKKESSYNLNSKEAVGVITNITVHEEKITLTIKNKEKLLITYYLKNNKINLNLGDKIKVKGEFIEPSSNKTKNLFNYKRYLYRKNIFYKVKANKIIVLSPNKNIYYYLKQKIINRFNNNPYLNTFLLGDKSYLDDKVKRSFQENGISHLFAISGMHITLLVSLIEKLLLKLKIKEEKRFKIISIILFLYLILVGLSPSILRGVLFYILFKLNSIYYFYIKPLNLFLLTISISLLINPNYLYDVGFQYSYIVSLSLISLSNNIKDSSYIVSLFKVSLISLFVSIPITLYNFYQINLLSILYNLIFVPFVSIIIFPLSLIVFLIKPLEPIYILLTSLLEKLSLIFSHISIGKLIFKRLPIFVYIIYFIIVLFYILRSKKEYLYLLIILLFFHLISPSIFTNTYVKYIDVGQGDSILLHIKNKNILIDTGGSLTSSGEIANNTIIPILKSEGIKKINYIIITHGDADHMGETIDLINNFKVNKVIFNCGEYNALEKKLIKVIEKKNIKYYSCIKELNIDKYRLQFLNTSIYDNENDNSNVIYLNYNNLKFLFMGDAGIEKENDILEKYNIESIDFLKVGHHGSKTSSSKYFIDSINPKYSIISVGVNNRYNHPNKEILENLENTKIYRTDQNGSITFKIKNNKLEIETYTS